MGIVPEPEPEPAARSLADLQSMHATDFRLVASEIGAAVAGQSPPTPGRIGGYWVYDVQIVRLVPAAGAPGGPRNELERIVKRWSQVEQLHRELATGLRRQQAAGGSSFFCVTPLEAWPNPPLR
jgi:hypothetical protein